MRSRGAALTKAHHQRISFTRCMKQARPRGRHGHTRKQSSGGWNQVTWHPESGSESTALYIQPDSTFWRFDANANTCSHLRAEQGEQKKGGCFTRKGEATGLGGGRPCRGASNQGMEQSGRATARPPCGRSKRTAAAINQQSIPAARGRRHARAPIGRATA